MVRQGSAKPSFTSSNLVVTSKKSGRFDNGHFFVAPAPENGCLPCRNFGPQRRASAGARDTRRKNAKAAPLLLAGRAAFLRRFQSMGISKIGALRRRGHPWGPGICRWTAGAGSISARGVCVAAGRADIESAPTEGCSGAGYGPPREGAARPLGPGGALGSFMRAYPG